MPTQEHCERCGGWVEAPHLCPDEEPPRCPECDAQMDQNIHGEWFCGNYFEVHSEAKDHTRGNEG